VSSSGMSSGRMRFKVEAAPGIGEDACMLEYVPRLNASQEAENLWPNPNWFRVTKRAYRLRFDWG
jgi:hypothetical protein